MSEEVSEDAYVEALRQNPWPDPRPRSWFKPHPPACSPLEVAAYHEAGHCIANLVFGVPIKEVWVSEDGRGGCLREVVPAEAYVRLVAALAGPLAEFEYAGRADLGGPGRKDKAHADAAIAKLTSAQVGQAQRYSRQLVKNFWPLIHDLASHLIRLRRLTGADVLKIVGKDNIHAETDRTH